MRKLPLILLTLTLVLTACSGASRRGEAAGRAFLEAWGDTASMRQVVQRFDALREDSLRWPWEVKAANRAMADVLIADGRDSLFQAAFAIVLSPRELAQLKCPPLVELMLARQVETDSIAVYVDLIHWLCSTVGHERHVEVFDSTLQAIVDGFSLTEQMTVYAQCARPDALGAALADDANQPDADMQEIDARIEILRKKIYSGVDFATFEAAYKAGLKSQDIAIAQGTNNALDNAKKNDP